MKFYLDVSSSRSLGNRANGVAETEEINTHGNRATGEFSRMQSDDPFSPANGEFALREKYIIYYIYTGCMCLLSPTAPKARDERY